jgi:hypothetical protein
MFFAGLAQGVDPDMFAQTFQGWFHVTVNCEVSKRHPQAVGRGLDDEVTVRDIAFITRGQEQKLAALTLVGTEETGIGHIAEPRVIGRTKHIRRKFHIL